MKRREFMKAMGALGMTTVAPSLFSDKDFISSVQASPDIQNAVVDLTTDPMKRTPQVINIFLYGGASELAGNLTNISDLNVHSQSKYAGPTALNPIFTSAYNEVDALNTPNADVGQVTPNSFWANAGGIIMEDMLYEGDMAIYRTCNRRKNNTRAHRPSIFSGQKGTLDIDSAPGLGTTLASVIANNAGTYASEFGVASLEELVMPMVSFEGESTTFALNPDPNASPIPLVLKPVGLSANFDNPYQRTPSTDQEPTKSILNDLVDSKMKANPNSVEGDQDFDDLTADYGERYKKVSESFLNHKKLATKVERFNFLVNDLDPADPTGNTEKLSLPLLPERDPDGSNAAFDLDLYTAFLNAVGGTGRFFDHQDPPVAYGSEQNGLDIQRVPRLNLDGSPALDGGGVRIIDTFFIDLDLGAQIQNPDGTPLNTLGDMSNDPRLDGGPGNNRLIYPQQNRFAELLRAAVTLCIHNPDTKLAMVGSPGLGGWDDHNAAMMSYEGRMQTLMSAVRAAVKHIKYASDDLAAIADRGAGNDTSNIVINIFTDFGRNANLNNSQGWDHGNNQNFYTFGGRPLIRLDPARDNYTLSPAELAVQANNPAELILPVRSFDHDSIDATRTPLAAVRPAGALGKIVGQTTIFGTPGANRLFTKPSEATDDASLNALTYLSVAPPPSYEFEPQAIAATIFGWFGITNPETLTKNDHDDFSTGGVTRMGTDPATGAFIGPETVNRNIGEPIINERVAGITLSTTPLTVKNIAV